MQFENNDLSDLYMKQHLVVEAAHPVDRDYSVVRSPYMTKEIRAALDSPSVSYWLKNALSDALIRDPLDALRDAEHLAKLIKGYSNKVSQQHGNHELN